MILARGKIEYHMHRFVTGFTPLGKIERAIHSSCIVMQNIACGILLNMKKKDILRESRKTIRFSQTGFTILELLVVVAIIALIASFVFVQTTGIRAKSRDANREEMMKQFQNALDLYHITYLRYPICSEVVVNGTTDCLSAALVGAGAFTAAPVDPLGASTGVCGDLNDYVFCYESATGSDYILQYHLETGSIQGKSPEWQTVTP